MIEYILTIFIASNEFVACHKDLPPQVIENKTFCSWTDKSCSGCYSLDYLIETSRVREVWNMVLK
jgi:hypothetical protein